MLLSDCIIKIVKKGKVKRLSKPKIVVLQLKELIYTLIFVSLGILLIILLVNMFSKNDRDADLSSEEQLYTPGVYSAALILRDTALNLEVVVNQDSINSVKLVNIDEATATMHPLIEPSLEHITDQLYSGVAVDNVELSNDGQYTQTILLDTIKVAIEKAKPKTVD